MKTHYSGLFARIILFLAISSFLFNPTVFAKNDKKVGKTQAYLNRLKAEGKERVIIRFKDKIDTDIVTQYNGKLIRKLKIINAVVCEVNQNAIEHIKQNPNIETVAADMIVRIPETREVPAESIEENQRADKSISLLYGGAAPLEWNVLEDGVNSKAAWDNYGLDGTGVKIVYIDSGVNYTLPDIDAHYLGGYDFVDDDGDPFTNNVNEDHGTKVVSTSIGEGDSKVVGVAPHTSYYSVRVIDASGTGLVGDVISGIYWAIDPDNDPNTEDQADIINMSLTTYGGEPLWETVWKPAFREACNAAYEAGIVLVAGSGNAGYDYSGWPARFTNVISVGAHDQDQLVWEYSNGGVDVVAPGARVPAIKPDNSAWWVWGTSMAAPHASALIALQLQYSRENNIEINNGYNWEVMKHSAHHLTGEVYDPVYQGEGKIYAANTDSNDINIGSIDLIAANWPIDYDFRFNDYAFTDANIPVYQIGQDVNEIITLTNITNLFGNTTETIENINITAIHTYYGEPNDLPGSSVKVFPTITSLEPADANSIVLFYSYTIPSETVPGLKKTKLELEFNFVGNSRVIQISHNGPESIWYAAIPGDLDIDNRVDLIDFGIFSNGWKQTGCSEPDYCGRADIDRSSGVGLSDLSVIAEYWMSGL